MTPLALPVCEVGRDPLGQDVPGALAKSGRFSAELRVSAAVEDDIEHDSPMAIGIVRSEHVDRQDRVQSMPQAVQGAARAFAALHGHQPGAVGVRGERHPVAGPVKLPSGGGPGQDDLDGVLMRHD
ncbi:hypothetical protein ABZ372_12400 [Streptomyces sp. NPDC005921]|uniref:hypothetical protein n=1 Tax=Streptomyces sp. NPDC005827 TaxID=3157070 RepID=UPI0033D7715E